MFWGDDDFTAAKHQVCPHPGGMNHSQVPPEPITSTGLPPSTSPCWPMWSEVTSRAWMYPLQREPQTPAPVSHPLHRGAQIRGFLQPLLR